MDGSVETLRAGSGGGEVTRERVASRCAVTALYLSEKAAGCPFSDSVVLKLTLGARSSVWD
jgi:hypothetical protein